MAESFPFAFTHKSVLAELDRSLATMVAIQEALHPDAGSAERQALEKLIDVLSEVRLKVENETECPNGMFTIFTIDKDKLEDIAATLGE